MYLVHTSGPVHIVHDGLFVSPELAANATSVWASVEVEGDSTSPISAQVMVELLEAGVRVSNATAVVSVHGGATTVARLELPLQHGIKRWSIQAPHMYSVQVWRAGVGGDYPTC